MKHFCGPVLFGLVLVFPAPAGAQSSPAAAPVPTFSKDVAPIFYRSCVSAIGRARRPRCR